ncbi:uncharacterized protein LOC105636423 isoform X2 [Jatropha curcas]|uniref:uncharacterized protein LOC105636423 isoform X2 n=1 Tax=Jatropha curcas TaxID=180498 RepID=UPI0005FB5081|nr:uncharacterized protein LOC105636423 isoform X2 [Jatropha curcas]
MNKKASRKSPIPMPSASSPPTPKSTILRKKKPNLADSPKTIASISDLKDMSSSRLHHVKSNLIDHSHSEILKDLEAFHSRLHKRFKVMDEAENDFKEMSEQINESCEAMKESYEELLADARATSSRLCKTTIPELARSCDKAIGNLQSRFGIPST